MSLKTKFCKKPFTWLELGRHEQGAVHCHSCCPSWLPEIVGDLKKETIDEIWNGEVYRRIRRSILDGSFRYCNHDLCPLISDNRLPERSDVKDPYLEDIIKNKREVLSKGPLEINMANDLSCNLSCPSCRTKEIMLSHGSEYEAMVNMHEQLLENVLKDLELLILCSGGDPLASKYYRQLLTTLKGSQYPQLKIQLVTNGTLLNEEMWQQMSGIHNNIGLICVSVDAAKESTYRVVRRGGDFNKLKKNLDFLGELRKKKAFDLLQLDFVVQNRNYNEMVDFANWGLTIGADIINFQRIVNWGTFSDEGFLEQAVYLKGHKNNQHFVRTLNDPIFDKDEVMLGNLYEFKK